MDEDAHGALRPAEHAGDLRGRHLVDEAQHERPAAVGGEAPDGGPRLGDIGPLGGPALDVERVADDRGGLERRLGTPASGAALIGDDVAGDAAAGPNVERAVAVGRPCPLSKREQGQRGERPFRGVLGVVMVAELVVRLRIHLGEIPAIERFEGGWVAPSGLDERPVAVEGDPRAPASSAALTLPNTGRAIPVTRAGRSGLDRPARQPDVTTSPLRTDRVPAAAAHRRRGAFSDSASTPSAP